MPGESLWRVISCQRHCGLEEKLMLKQKRQLVEFFFVATDLLVVSLSWLLAYWLRFKTDLIPVQKGIPPLGHYLSMLLFIWLIWAFVYNRFGYALALAWILFVVIMILAVIVLKTSNYWVYYESGVEE